MTVLLPLPQLLDENRVDVLKFIRYRIEAGKRGFLTRPADDWQISFEQDRISITHTDFRPFLAKGETEHNFAWSNVERILAGQSDNLTWDTIWVTFFLADGASCAVPETAQGWAKLLEHIPAHLPGALRKEDWLPLVTRTAFDANITQLYEAPAENSLKPTAGFKSPL